MVEDNNLREQRTEVRIIVSIIVILIIVLFILIYNFPKYKKVKVENHEYNVIDLHNKQNDLLTSAKLLAKINERINVYIDYMIKTYGRHNKLVANMIKRYNPDTLYEQIPSVIDKNVAFTTSKGKDIKLCLRQVYRDKTKMHDINTLMYVMLHELSHLATNAKQHPREFWGTFKFVLATAVDAGVYEAVDYRHNPVMYCNGMNITYNPLFDANLVAVDGGGQM